MDAKEARKLAEQFTPDVKEILDLIRLAAMNDGKFSLNPPDHLICNSRVREQLESLGYTLKWYDVQRYGYWEISW